MKKKLISIISPLYNEGEGVSELCDRLFMVFKPLQKKYDLEIILVDDGSGDNTFREIEAMAQKHKNLKAVGFSRNFGHQIALTAGYDLAKGDAVICIDGDLQQPPELIPAMVKKWEEGNDLVYTIRKENDSTSLFKRLTTYVFYSVINRLSNINIDRNVADFRLMSKPMLDEFLKMRERDRFVRGMVNWLGYKRDFVEYEVKKRKYGKSKYSLVKLMAFALNAITSFSGAPLRLAFVVGFTIAILSFLYGFYLIVSAVVFGANFPAGWLSVLVSILFLGGVQLIFIGILGEYTYKMFDENKKRPLYVINKRINL